MCQDGSNYMQFSSLLWRSIIIASHRGLLFSAVASILLTMEQRIAAFFLEKSRFGQDGDCRSYTKAKVDDTGVQCQKRHLEDHRAHYVVDMTVTGAMELDETPRWRRTTCFGGRVVS